jgi:threonine/homoserine/homoserine lactone efflux protein
MIESLLLGTVLGLIAGLVPGAFFAIVATTTLERGLKKGIQVALIPLGTELPVLFVTALLLTQLPGGVLRWVGMVGGLLLIYIAWNVIQDAREADPLSTDGARPFRGHLVRVILVGLLSPSPWAFWFFIGSPLAVNRWHVGPWHSVAFVGAFMTFFVLAMVLLAWAVSTGRDYLNLEWYRRCLRGAGAALGIIGGVLIWQSWEGNFSEMVQAPEAVEEQVR